MWQIIRDALQLDVSDLNYLFTPHNIKYTLLSHVGIPQRGLLIRILSFFRQWIRQLPFATKSTTCPPNRVLFFVATENQKRALLPLAEKLPTSCLVGIHKAVPQQISLFGAYTYSFFFFPLVLWQFLRARGDREKAFFWMFDAYWVSYGYYITMRLFLRRTRPAALVVANDHVMWTRALVLAAQQENIPTVYVQHASVTERFPPLTVDYALLEGEDSLYKYAACGPSSSHIFLVGVPRFDGYADQVNCQKQVRVVGIGTNTQNTAEQVHQLGQKLQRLPEIKFIFRPHPSDTRKEMWQQLAVQYGWGFSNPSHETAFQFLTHIDALIAGESNIHLEAALLNVVPLYYDFLGQRHDFYGFLRRGLVEGFTEPEQVAERLMALCQHKPDVRSKTKWYCSTVDTPFNGRSAELAVRLIQAIATKDQNLGEGWQPLATNATLKAYEYIG